MRMVLWGLEHPFPLNLDLIGNAKITGLTTTITLGVAQTANFYNDLKVVLMSTIDPTTGDVTATNLLEMLLDFKIFSQFQQLVGFHKE